MKTVLIGAPIRQKTNILSCFLRGLEEADKDGLDVSFFFVDDNTETASTDLLQSFATHYKVVLVRGAEMISSIEDNDYVCDDSSHHWCTENITRITCFKDKIIEYCIQNGFDYLFLVDSDIVIGKDTLTHLISRNVEIVSNVFWTQWTMNSSLVPQCFWIPDLYQQNAAFNQPLDPSEANRIRREMTAQMKISGIYPVDGLGACTMIAKSALEKGVRFKVIPNLSVPGEDRHFCIRAGALGISLYMDTVQPVYHIYREEYLSRVDEYLRDGFKFDMCQTHTEPESEKKKKKKGFLRTIRSKWKKIFR